MIPYGKHSLTDGDVEEVVEALRSDLITQGPRIEEFEQSLREHFGCDHAVVVNNGTMALFLVYQALELSVGDRLYTTPNTFAATANTAAFFGVEPVFLDIDPETFCFDREGFEQLLNDSDHADPSVVTSVDFAGYPQDKEHLASLAEEHDFFLLEDACHAPGASWQDSRGEWVTVGSCEYVDAATLSFHPVKHLTTGEGGAVLTNDTDLAERIRTLRTHGITKDDEKLRENHGPWYYEVQSIGLNGRITDFQCALGMSQLERLSQNLSRRREIAGRYQEAFKSLQEVETPAEPDEVRHAFHLYVILTEERDELYDYLTDHGISPQVHYIPLHLQPYYQKEYDYETGDLPRAENYYERALSLPMFSTLPEDDLDHVISTVRSFYR